MYFGNFSLSSFTTTVLTSSVLSKHFTSSSNAKISDLSNANELKTLKFHQPLGIVELTSSSYDVADTKAAVGTTRTSLPGANVFPTLDLGASTGNPTVGSLTVKLGAPDGNTIVGLRTVELGAPMTTAQGSPQLEYCPYFEAWCKPSTYETTVTAYTERNGEECALTTYTSIVTSSPGYTPVAAYYNATGVSSGMATSSSFPSNINTPQKNFNLVKDVSDVSKNKKLTAVQGDSQIARGYFSSNDEQKNVTCLSTWGTIDDGSGLFGTSVLQMFVSNSTFNGENRVLQTYNNSISGYISNPGMLYYMATAMRLTHLAVSDWDWKKPHQHYSCSYTPENYEQPSRETMRMFGMKQYTTSRVKCSYTIGCETADVTFGLISLQRGGTAENVEGSLIVLNPDNLQEASDYLIQEWVKTSSFNVDLSSLLFDTYFVDAYIETQEGDLWSYETNDRMDNFFKLIKEDLTSLSQGIALYPKQASHLCLLSSVGADAGAIGDALTSSGVITAFFYNQVIDGYSNCKYSPCKLSNGQPAAYYLLEEYYQEILRIFESVADILQWLVEGASSIIEGNPVSFVMTVLEAYKFIEESIEDPDEHW
ncbi:uncharacterized protein PRCAT00003487001 [Priceomyces carsonii]|uniref:uncharacterized protein n=1 Tax=Priceomyces carsonii TaxID=28549 RepID=UPI002EDBB0F6|nr:unnamed protein product [Priceomyces carsonii]